jgi:hypothetical protein
MYITSLRSSVPKEVKAIKETIQILQPSNRSIVEQDNKTNRLCKETIRKGQTTQEETHNTAQEEVVEVVQQEVVKIPDLDNEFIHTSNEKENNSYYLYSVNLTF